MVLIRGPNFDFLQIGTNVLTAEEGQIISVCAVHFTQFAKPALDTCNLCNWGRKIKDSAACA